MIGYCNTCELHPVWAGLWSSMILRIKILQVTSLARIACSVILYIEEVFFFFWGVNALKMLLHEITSALTAERITLFTSLYNLQDLRVLASGHRTSFSSSASDGDRPRRQGTEPAYSFVGMHCIFDQCRASGNFVRVITIPHSFLA